jgi:hypothetical protein
MRNLRIPCALRDRYDAIDPVGCLKCLYSRYTKQLKDAKMSFAKRPVFITLPEDTDEGGWGTVSGIN